jgi:hypothetical protein
MMIALGTMAVVLATERLLFDYVVSQLASFNAHLWLDDEHLWRVAVAAWVTVNIALFAQAGILAPFVRDAMKDYAKAQRRKR